MVLVTTGIHHAIREYEKGHRITLRFEGAVAESMYIGLLRSSPLMALLNNEQYTDYLVDLLATYRRVRHTWEDQVAERRERILQIILGRVKRYAGYDRKLELDNTSPVANPFKDSLADLDNPDVDYSS